MDPYQETFDTWNTIASLYQDKFMDLDLYNDTYDFICRTLTKPKASLLEIGCGPGNITRYLLSKRPDFDILAIDIAPNMIALAEKNNPTARFAVMDSRDISTLKTFFDGIVCGFCLPYLSPVDGMKCLVDCYKLLHDDGLLYISFVEGNPSESGYQTGSSGHRCYFYYYTLEAVQQQLLETGFEELRVFKVKYTKSATATAIHTIVTARKKVL